MIISTLKGGLGNMMFQIAAGYSIALNTQSEYRYTLDRWRCVTKYDISKYEATVFKNIKRVSLSDISGDVQLYVDDDLSYKPLPHFSNTKNVIVDGYFQSENHFGVNKEAIKNLFCVPENTKYTDYAFMHFRRKDYLIHSNIHNNLPQKYYIEAMNILQPKKLLILSDDIEWCKENIKGSDIDFVEGTTDIEDICIMRSCKQGAIIANSTFSWWGAWLAQPEKVIAPKQWFNQSSPIKNWSDIYVPSWITI